MIAIAGEKKYQNVPMAKKTVRHHASHFKSSITDFNDGSSRFATKPNDRINLRDKKMLVSFNA